jgi:hypothetical protein
VNRASREAHSRRGTRTWDAARPLQFTASMNARLLSSLLASSTLLTFAACGGGSDDPSGNPEYDADFSAASENHRGRAIMAAMGFDAMIAQLTVSGYAAFPDDTTASCPTITKNGDETTVTGGCTMDDGTSVEGTIVFSNVPSLFGRDHDPSKPTEMRFERFALVSPPGPEADSYSYDGTIVREPSGKLTIDLTATIGGIQAQTELELQCDELCAPTEGSWVRVQDLGTAGIEGSWSLSAQVPAGNLILDGEQMLVAEIADATQQCIPYSIDGVDQPALCTGE